MATQQRRTNMSDTSFSLSLGFVVVAFVGMCLVLVPTAFFFKLAWRLGPTGKLFTVAVASMLAMTLAVFTVPSEYPADFESSAGIFIVAWGVIIWPSIVIFYFVMGAKTWFRQRKNRRETVSTTHS